MKYCSHCGSQNEDSTRYCVNCGAGFPVSEPAQEQVYSPEPEPAPAPEPVSNPYYQQTYNTDYYRPTMNDMETKTVSGLAVAGFVISLVSILCCGATSVIGLIFSIAGLISASRKSKSGLGLAIAGLIISGIMTLFIILSIAISWTAIEAAYEATDDGDLEEFVTALQEELEEADNSGSRRSRSSGRLRDTEDDDDNDIDDDDIAGAVSGAWTDYVVSSDYSTVTITYTDGIPDNFEFYGGDFDDICDVLEENMVVEDNFGVPHGFDRDEYRRLVSMVLISPEEYERLDLSRSEVIDTMAYLATLSFEMYHDGFVPDEAVYTEATNVYDFYGIIERNNIGHAVVVFTDGTNDYEFDDAMCGDEICWSVDPSDTSVFRLGLTSDTLSEYPSGGFDNVTAWAESFIDDVI